MSPVAPRRPGSLSTMSGPAIAIIVVGSAIAAVALLSALGVIDLSKLRSNEPDTAGLIGVPTAAVQIPAHTRIRRDHLWDRTNARIAVVYLPPRAATKEMLLNITQIIGRVLDSDKEPGYVFTDTDFLPRGTREGLVAGIPAGKRAIRVSADRVEGLFGLNAGDRFDIVATMPIDANSGGRSLTFGGPYGQEVALEAELSNWDKQATVRVIVQNAVIVEPLVARGAPVAPTSAQAAAARARAIQEAVIAVNPNEVALLTEAMAVEAKLASVPRSGRPDDPINSRTPDLRPFSPFAAPGSANQTNAFSTVETIMGQKRAVTAVPRP
jgi:Flp pilus assembly protein CpaB